MLVTVEVVDVVEHPMSEFRDIFLLRVMCPFCSDRHQHGAVYCERGKILDLELLEGNYGPVTPSCHKGEYMIRLPGTAVIQDMIRKS